jgi:GT2 family glycosyltransferase
MDVSILIVNYNTSGMLRQCLESIKAKVLGLRYEIIVVDNCSVDDSVQMVIENYPEIRLITNTENVGFGVANNMAAEVAIGAYLFLLNTDTLLINDAPTILYNYMEDGLNSDVGISGGNLYKSNYAPNFSYSTTYPSLFNLLLYRLHLSRIILGDNFNSTGQNKEVAVIIGAGLFIRKNLFDYLDGFDPSFFMYVEDGDLSYRVKQLNYRIISVPEAKIIHLQGKSSSSVFKYVNEVSGYLYYFKKHHGTSISGIYLLMEKAVLVLKIIISFVSNNDRKKSEFYSMIRLIGDI